MYASVKVDTEQVDLSVSSTLKRSLFICHYDLIALLLPLLDLTFVNPLHKLAPIPRVMSIHSHKVLKIHRFFFQQHHDLPFKLVIGSSSWQGRQIVTHG